MSTWTQIAQVTVGTPNGHVPGHQFHDVTATIEKRGERLRVTIRELAGSCLGTGDDDVQHMAKVVAIEDYLDIAVRIANSRAQAAGINEGKMVQALSQAHAVAEDAEQSAAT